MLDVLPAIAFAVVVLAWLTLRRRPRLQLRADLTAAIEGASVGPIVDAGSATLVVVANVLALDPRDVPPAQPRPTNADEDDAWHVREIIRPLGLDVAELEPAACPQLAGGAAGRTLMRGTRHGRPVSVALREDRSEVRVGLEDGPGFEVALTGGEWQGSGIVPDTVTDALEGVAPNRRWEGALIRRDAAGIALRRTPESSRSWMHDLWLAELVARAAERAPATVTDGAAAPAVLAPAVASA